MSVTEQVMIGGAVIMVMGFLAAWTDRAYGVIHILLLEDFEDIGRWLMRAGAAIFSLGFAAHLFTLVL